MPKRDSLGITNAKSSVIEELVTASGACHAFAMTEHVKKKLGDLLVGMTAMSAIAHILMQHLMSMRGDNVSIDSLRDLVSHKLKNADIQGLDYDQQARLVARAVGTAERFFEHYSRKIREAKEE